MRKILAVLLVALALRLGAADVKDTTLVMGYQTDVLAAVTNLAGCTSAVSNLLTRTLTVPVSTCSVVVSYKLGGAGTSGALFTFQKSYNGSDWETLLSTNIAGNGTARVFGIAALTLNDFGRVRLSDVWNTNNAVITNLSVQFFYKQP